MQVPHRHPSTAPDIGTITPKNAKGALLHAMKRVVPSDGLTRRVWMPALESYPTSVMTSGPNEKSLNHPLPTITTIHQDNTVRSNATGSHRELLDARSSSPFNSTPHDPCPCINSGLTSDPFCRCIFSKEARMYKTTLKNLYRVKVSE